MKIPRLTKKQKMMWKTTQFLIRLTLFSTPLYVILWLNPSMTPVQNVVADHAAWLLNLLGFEVMRDNLILGVGTENPFLFYIGPDCIGWKSMLCFIALIFATLDARMKKRIMGIVIGIPIIYLGNLFRIMIVVLIERNFGLEAAMVFHDWLWQAGLITLVIMLWLIWLKFDYVKSSAFSFLKK